jgi:hypothetical protein
MMKASMTLYVLYCYSTCTILFASSQRNLPDAETSPRLLFLPPNLGSLALGHRPGGWG